MGVAVGVDIGGTFTDVIVTRPRSEESWVCKVPTNAEDYGEAVLEGVRRALRIAGASATEIERVVHGTTIGTNAVVEQGGARIGILTTAGFEDTLYIGRQKRTEMYDLFIDAETPNFLCPRERVFGIPGRMSPDGEVLEDLDEDRVLRAAEALVSEHDVEVLAVCFLFAFTNPAHEERAAELIADRYPDLELSLSSRVDARFREYERLVVTAFDAYIKPIVGRYVRRLRRQLEEDGVSVPLHVMESHGGAVDSSLVEERAAGTLLSGLAAGVLGGRAVGEQAGQPDLITFDVGGTSADVALIVGNRPLITDEGQIGRYPVRQPMVDLATIGAGGGSIAYVDAAGSLRVGPHSAGARPGPAAYGRGGLDPTVTDASLILGFLGEEGLVGGSLKLRRDLAERAISERVHQPLGLGLAEAAWGIHRIINAAMADAVRLVSIRRGHDPRRFTLVAAGGAGPVHACSVAEELGIGQILVPPFPGLLSAYGLLAAAVQVQEWKTLRARLDELAPEELHDTLRELADTCMTRLQRSGANVANAHIAETADMRYVGQSHELTVSLDGQRVTASTLSQVSKDFAATHERVYGHSDPEGQVEVISLRVTVSLPQTAPLVRRTSNGAHRAGQRDVYLPEVGGYEAVPIVPRNAIDEAFDGPAIVTQDDTTIVVRDGWRVRPAAAGGPLVLERRE